MFPSFISKEEFLGNHAPRRASTPTEKADRAFGMFDKNHDGYITKEEMMRTSKNITKAQVRYIKTALYSS